MPIDAHPTADTPARNAPRSATDSRETRDRLRRVASHIGGRIRARRTELGLTQEQLGQALGVSYQQVQKYETAANRISAGRLYQLAAEFGVDTAFFFEGLAETFEPSQAGLPHGGHNRSAIELVRNYLALENEEVRTALSGLLKALREQ